MSKVPEQSSALQSSPDLQKQKADKDKVKQQEKTTGNVPPATKPTEKTAADRPPNRAKQAKSR